MKTLKQQFNSATSGAIVHLRGRERALEGFGWAGRQAEWIALACLHGGVFTRAQWTSFLGCHHEKVCRAVHALVAQGVAVERIRPASTASVECAESTRAGSTGRSAPGTTTAAGSPPRKC